MAGLCRNVDGQTPGVLRELLVFSPREATLSAILLSLPPLRYLEMFQRMFFGSGDFCISFPWSIRPEPLFCSITARSEWLVISCVPLWIRFWTVGFLPLFLPRWRLMSLLLKSIPRPGACTHKTSAGKSVVHFSAVRFPELLCWDGPNYTKLFVLFLLLPLFSAAPAAFPVSPSLSGGEREDSEGATASFETQKKGKFRAICQIKEQMVLERISFPPCLDQS